MSYVGTPPPNNLDKPHGLVSNIHNNSNNKNNNIRATYVRAVCEIRPHKIENQKIRLTAGGNLIYYPGEVSTPTSELTTMKIHVNSAVSDMKSIYMCMDVKYFT